MSAISDRDKKIIYFMLIIMVICLPYFFFIKNKKVETGAIKAEVETLQARYDELQEMNLHRQDYIDETEEMNAKRDAIIALYPGDIKQANYTMFLLQTEYSGEYETEESGARVRTNPIWFSDVAYGQNIDTAISSAEADTGLTGITYTSVIGYQTYYGGLKYMLEYLMDYQDPMIYTKINMSFDEESGLIEGEMTLAQYAVTGEDRPTLDDPDFTITVDGALVDLDLDDAELRGNTDMEMNGIFGPIIDDRSEEDETEADAAEGDDESADEAEGEDE